MPFEGGPPFRRFDILTTMLRWSPDGRSLLYVSNEGDVSNIWSQPIAGGPPKQVTHFNSEAIRNFDLSRDGKRPVMDRAAPVVKRG